FGESLLFFLGRMRRMIRRNHVDRPITQTFFNGLHVLPCSERGVHFRKRIKSAYHLFGQCEMMRTGLSRDLDSTSLGLADHPDRSFVTDVGKMQSGSRQLS